MPTKLHTSSSVIHEAMTPNTLSTQSKQFSTKTLAILCLIVLGIAAALMSWRWLLPTPISHGVVIQSPQRVANFTLTDHTGQEVALHDFRGQYVLLNFGYTYCPDVCPLTLATLADAAKRLDAERQQVQVLFVSVDPERDTPERLAQYITYFDPSFIGLTGSEEMVRAAATQFGVYYARAESEAGSESSKVVSNPESYLVDHTATVLLIDPQGYLRVLFPYGVSAEEMASDLSILIN